MAITNEALLVRLKDIEGEIADLKRQLKAKPPKRTPITLRGIWKSVEITDQEIEDVKKAWSKVLDDESI